MAGVIVARKIGGLCPLFSQPIISKLHHSTDFFVRQSQATSTNHRFKLLIRQLQTGPIIKSTTKRAIDRSKQPNQDDDGAWSVIAYNLSEELRIGNAHRLLEKFNEYQIIDLPDDLQDEAVLLSLKDNPSTASSKPSTSRPLNDVLLFSEGSIVFWGVPYDQQKRLLYGLSPLKVNPNRTELIQEEKEHMSYTLSNTIERSSLSRDTIQLATRQDVSQRRADQFAFSHAIAQSVKLGIWEMTLDAYIESVSWITDSMKSGKDIKLTRDQVFRKTGEILGLKHDINLSSDLLDLPDIYWDRREQEDMFLSVIAHLNIRKRTNVINEKLNNCCELMNLLASHMNDRHHIRLEWMIIALITVEVMFEIARFL